MSFSASYAICRACHLPEHVAEVAAAPLCRCREQPSAELAEELARHRAQAEELQARVATAERERDDAWREMCEAARLLEEQARKGRPPSRQCRECRRRAQMRFVERRRLGGVRSSGPRPWVRRHTLLGLLDAGYTVAQLARWARTEPEVIQARLGGAERAAGPGESAGAPPCPPLRL